MALSTSDILLEFEIQSEIEKEIGSESRHTFLFLSFWKGSFSSFKIPKIELAQR